MTQEQEALRARAKELEAAALKEAEVSHNYRQVLLLNKQLQEVARALKDSRLEYKAILRGGNAALNLGELPEALGLYQQARAIAHAQNNTFDEAGALLQQAKILSGQGKKSEAKKAIQEAVNLISISSDRRALAGFFSEAGYICSGLGETALGLEYLERAELLNRSMGNFIGVAITLNLRSFLYRIAHQIPKALEVTLATLELRRQLEDWPEVVVEYVNLARLYQTLGEPEKALSYLLRGLDEAKAHGLQSSIKAVELQSNVSGVYQSLGKFEDALRYNQQALEGAQKLGDTWTQANLLSDQGNLWSGRGRFEEALKALDQALTLARAHGNRRREGDTLVQIGSVHAQRRDSVRARAHYEKALQLQRTSGERQGEASTLQALAREYFHQPEIARQHIKRAQALYRYFDDHAGEVSTLTQLAQLEQSLGRTTAAESAYRQAIALAERLRTEAGEGLAGQGTFFETLSASYIGYMTFLLDHKRAAEAFALVQKTKARGLLDLMASGKIDLSRQLTEDEREEERQRRQKCDALSTAMVREAALNEPGSKKRFEATKRELVTAERELALFQDTLYAKHTGLGQRRGATTVNLAQVAKTLPATAALLEFAPLDNGQMALFVATRSSQGKLTVTATRLAMSINELEGRIAALRTACTSPKNPWQDDAKKLYQALLAPAEARLRGKTQLILCPDRGLWDVPFATLTDKTGTPLLERFALSYANSATTWHAAQTAPRKPSASPKLLVVANPQFDAEKRFENGSQVPGQRPITVPDRPITVPDRPITVPDRLITVPDRPLTVPDRDLYVPRGTRLVDLPGTQREADALAKRFPQATVYTRDKAQESVVKKSASQFQRIHLASHAFVNDAAPLLSSVVLANPTPDSGDDGFLTAREIFELDLSGVELVVLSACNTARGAKQGGEGVMGLTWALFAAGCPTQVLSQWAVDDSSTATLMTRFYDSLAKGQGKSAALRQAALSLRTSGKYAHPYFWAPFVLIGDPR